MSAAPHLHLAEPRVERTEPVPVKDALHEIVSGEWYTRSLPHLPGPYSKWELVPLVGAAVTVRRMARDEPNLTDRFSGHFLVPIYHVATVGALYNLGSLAVRLL